MIALAQSGPFLAIIHNAGIQVDAPLIESSEAEIVREILANMAARRARFYTA